MATESARAWGGAQRGARPGGITQSPEEADRCGRAIDPGHWGALVIYTRDGEVPERLAKALATRRPDVNPREVLAVGLAEARARLEQFAAEGFTKFVLAPAHEPPSWDDELADMAGAVLDLQQ